jgi:hypothetical protein
MVRIIEACEAGEYELPGERLHPPDAEIGSEGGLLFLGLAGQC